MKYFIKWMLIIFGVSIATFLSSFEPYVIIYIFPIMISLGGYLMLNPSLFIKSVPKDIHLFDIELKRMFLEYHSMIDQRRKELLTEFRIAFWIICFFGTMYVFTACIFFLYLNHLENKVLLGLNFLIFIGLFVIFEEKSSVLNKIIKVPFSRNERVRTKYFYDILNDEKRLNQIIKVDLDEKVFYENKKVEDSRSQTHIKINYNIIENNLFNYDNRSISNFHVDNRIINNDNRLFNNNFVSKIMYEKSESKIELNSESEFWSLFKAPKIFSPLDVKMEKFNETIAIINHNYNLIKKKPFIYYDEDKCRYCFYGTTNPVSFARLIKYLVKNNFLDKDDNSKFRNALMEIFYVKSKEDSIFKHFQPNMWDEVNDLF